MTKPPTPTQPPGVGRSLVLSVAFTALMVAIPWPAIWEAARGAPMWDRQVYALQIINGDLRSDYSQPDGLLSFLTDEYLWSYILDFLTRHIGLSIDATFLIISAATIWAAAFLIVRRCRTSYLLLLINPLFIDLAFSQLRIALAMVPLALLYASRTRSKLLYVILLPLCCAIHTAMALVLCVFLASMLAGRAKLSRNTGVQYIAVAALGLVGAIVVGPLRSGILAGFGDRRASVEYTQVQSGLGFYLIWVFILVLLSMNWRIVRASNAGRFAVAMLWMSLLTAASGGYADRLLAISLPFLIVAISRIAKDQIWIPWLAYTGFTVLHWLYWLVLI